jgi:hypothetical protein
MNDFDQPAWLRIMQNGSIGEARTKAFLLDRFWVLERSVDIDGADFLVQPRNPASRFTDRQPPKIGVVQAKYYQDRRTIHHIPRSYVLDQYGLPLKGFFAILHLGADDGAQIFMLSAADMAEALDQTAETPSRFIVGAKALADKFRVDLHRRQALDRIEHAVGERSVSDTLHFFDRVNIPIWKVTADDIDYRYKLPIPNPHADIPRTYYEYRDHLKWITYEMEEALTIIEKIMREPDPRAALAERENLEEYRAGGSWRDGLSFSTRKLDLDWTYLEEALDEHDKRVAALEAAGRLQTYVDLSHAVLIEALRLAGAMDPRAAAGKYLWLRLDYDPATLAFRRVRLTLKSEKPGRSKAALAESAYLHATKDKADVLGTARSLWHFALDAILLRICPDLVAED